MYGNFEQNDEYDYEYARAIQESLKEYNAKANLANETKFDLPLPYETKFDLANDEWKDVDGSKGVNENSTIDDSDERSESEKIFDKLKMVREKLEKEGKKMADADWNEIATSKITVNMTVVNMEKIIRMNLSFQQKCDRSIEDITKDIDLKRAAELKLQKKEEEWELQTVQNISKYMHDDKNKSKDTHDEKEDIDDDKNVPISMDDLDDSTLN